VNGQRRTTGSGRAQRRKVARDREPAASRLARPRSRLKFFPLAGRPRRGERRSMSGLGALRPCGPFDLPSDGNSNLEGRNGGKVARDREPAASRLARPSSRLSFLCHS
jgi:hypothetical protein